MASAPLRPRSTRALTTAAALAATATAHLAAAPQVHASPPTPLSAPAAPAATPAAPAQAVLAPRAPAPDPPNPTCGTPSTAGFPLDTRIHGGPADYPAGGSPQEWKLDLTNTTDAPCSGIHPVLVLTDRERVLRPEQIRFEFYDDGAARWLPVTFEATEEAENVGAFTGFGGFAVPAGRTLTVPVRLAFRAGTAPDEVVVNAAVVQRRGADGDWVGESGEYRLTVGPADTAAPTSPSPSTATEEPPGPAVSRAPDTSGTAAPSRPPGTASRPPAEAGDPTADPQSPELASTGPESASRAERLAPLVAALLVLGAVLVQVGRRRRHR
ncbi:hypothetical protein [Streptomyces sp. Qhu_M48]|uniref:hypothetical protein n=1 Tax=Streptomyces sp. Qhu_M48 TaxID=3435889 RepID=UPI003F4FEE70